MTQRNFISCFTLLLALFACSPSSFTEDEDVTSVSISADDFAPGVSDEADTKVVLNGYNILWTLSDTLGVFPQTGAQVYFNSTIEGSTTTQFDGGGWGFKNGFNYYSYSPFVGDIYLNRNHIPVSFSYQEQDGPEDTNIGECCFMYSSPTSSDMGELHFQYHHLGCILRVRATLPAGTYTDLAITAPSNVFVMDGWYNLMAATPVITPTRMANQIYTKLKNITLTSQTQIAVYLMLAPVNLQGTQITVSVLNSEQTEYQQQKTPPGAYVVGTLNGLTCDDLTAVPQSMGLIVSGWENGGNINGTAQ